MSGGYDRGSMRHVLTIEVRSFVPDGTGGFDEVWAPLPAAPTIYASMQQMAAGETARARGTITQQEYKIITAYRADIVAGMRLCADGRFYEVISVLDRSQRREYLEIRAISEG